MSKKNVTENFHGKHHNFNLVIDLQNNSIRDVNLDGFIDWVGDTVRTRRGILIINFAATDTNSLEFTDMNGDICAYPFIAAGSMIFDNNIMINEGDVVYNMFYIDPEEELMKNREEGLKLLLTKKWWEFWR